MSEWMSQLGKDIVMIGAMEVPLLHSMLLPLRCCSVSAVCAPWLQHRPQVGRTSWTHATCHPGLILCWFPGNS